MIGYEYNGKHYLDALETSEIQEGLITKDRLIEILGKQGVIDSLREGVIRYINNGDGEKARLTEYGIKKIKDRSY